MNHILKIMADVISLAVVIVGGGWLVIRSLKGSEDVPKLIFKWIFTGILIGIVFWHIVPGFKAGGFNAIGALIEMLLIGIAMAITWRHAIIDLIANPFASLYDGGNEPPDPKPLYSIALTKRKLNKPLDAIVAVREQLAKFPNDYEGILLLAGIQAEDMKDLPSAEMTLNHFCDWKDAPPKQVSAALMQLADWHLKIAQDSHSAQATLERIVERFPDTEMALVAKQRIAHLGGTEKILLSAYDRRAVAVPEGIQSAGLRDTIHDLIVPADANPAEQAQAYVKHLEQHPQDTEIREKLAVIYAEHYQRVDLAAIELEQLINEPNHPPKRVAHWLNLLADLQIHAGMDYDAVRPTLELIVQRFPDLPVANLAQSRLARLKLEIKGRQQQSSGVKLGVYEQNIGLKMK
ncbi:MAG TPA: tetratricopeptide repeat protein [Verrucomicrobiae bacterium]|nr:tetratricopeptide repeat protein [Verrucomicrobiae bacterium]